MIHLIEAAFVCFGIPAAAVGMAKLLDLAESRMPDRYADGHPTSDERWGG